jgi:hypothetical protein
MVRIGILLLEKTEIIIRIYEADDRTWRLLYYQSIEIEQPKTDDLDSSIFIEAIAEFLITEQAQIVNEWRASARGFPTSTLQQISVAIGFNFDNLTPLREQELICKGMFTELW